MNKIELLLQKFEINVDDGLENAQNILSQNLKDKLDENKMKTLLQHVEEYFEEQVEKEETLTVSDSTSTTEEKTVNLELKESNNKLNDEKVIDEKLKLSDEKPIETVKKDKQDSKSLEDVYRSYNNGNRLNKIWLVLSIALAIMLYFLIDNINVEIRKSGKINVLIQILTLILVVLALVAYYLDRKNFEFRKKTLSRILFLISNLTALLGLVLTYNLEKYESDLLINSFTMGMVFLRLSLMFSLPTTLTLYLSSFKHIEIKTSANKMVKKEVDTNE